MKFTCTKENLIYGLQVVSGLTIKPSNLPILSNILIIANESGVEFITTNLEVAIKAYVRAKVEKSGTFTLPAKTFLDFISLLSDEQVVIDLKGNEVVVSGGRSSTKIKGAGAEDFPVIPGLEEDHSYMISVEEIKKAFSQVVFSAAKNEIRPELSGVFFDFNTGKKNTLTLAATDSYRLSERQVRLSQGGDEFSCIVPSRTVSEFARLLSLSSNTGEKESGVRLWVSENQIAMRYDQFEITSRLIAGTYPDYTQIIPKEFKTTVVFPQDLLVKSVKAASLFTTTGVNAVSFEVRPGEKQVHISSTNTQTGEHESDLDVEIIGEENNIVLNHRYVLDGLQHIEGEDVELKMNGSDAPCLFKSKINDDYLYIVMPIRQ